LERAFVVLMLLSMYATGFTIGHGQLTIFVLCGLIAGVTLLGRSQRKWQRDGLVAVLFLVASVKPTLSLPFVWLVLFLPGTRRPALFVVGGYLALTLVAIAFQGFDPAGLFRAWFARGVTGATREAASGGYDNVHSWLAVLGLARWNLLASVLVLLSLGYWTYQHRQADLWLLLGVTALAARFWVYHRSYDDMLVLLPMIALFRGAKLSMFRNGGEAGAGVLLAVAVIVMFAPALLFVTPAWEPQLKEVQTPVRVAMSIFLVYWASYAPRTVLSSMSLAERR
jgi:hypothetical protein